MALVPGENIGHLLVDLVGLLLAHVSEVDLEELEEGELLVLVVHVDHITGQFLRDSGIELDVLLKGVEECDAVLNFDKGDAMGEGTNLS